MKLKHWAVSALTAASLAGFGSAQAVPVAAELALVIDVSGSVDSSEYLLQMNGYRSAFASASVGSAIESFASSGGIAVGVYLFATNVVQSIGWTQLSSAADATAFSASLAALAAARPGSGTAAIGGSTLGTSTNVAEGIDRATDGLAGNGFEGARRVIDVSGDGKQNTTRNGGTSCTIESATCNSATDAARDAAAALSITVNGLAIIDDVADLATWYGAHVRTGAGSFVETATFATFATAVERKIGRELTGTVPEPGTWALSGLALAALFAQGRRRTRA